MGLEIDASAGANRRARALTACFAVFFAVFALVSPLFCLPSRAQIQPVAPVGEAPNFARAIYLVEDGGAEGAGLVVDLMREASVKIEALAEPPRLVIDFPGVAFAAGVSVSGKGTGPVTAWRAGLFMMGQSRIVLDLARPALPERADFIRQGGMVRLVLPLRSATPEAFASRVETDRKQRLAARAPEPGPITPRAAGAKPLVVLDPGHGGIDSGALGGKGEMEKDIVLSTALSVKKALEADGRVEVAMTRDDDRFIALGERVRFARAKGAALFVSIHADSLQGEREVRGASIYTLSDRASDSLAARAAEKENRVDEAAGVDSEDETREGVEDILFDLARRETRLFSQVVAREAAGAFRKHARLHKTPLRGAKFRVLKAPDVPSILIELGYLTNAQDVQALGDTPERAALTKDLAAALIDFTLLKRNAIPTEARDGEPAP